MHSSCHLLQAVVGEVVGSGEVVVNISTIFLLFLRNQKLTSPSCSCQPRGRFSPSLLTQLLALKHNPWRGKQPHPQTRSTPRWTFSLLPTLLHVAVTLSSKPWDHHWILMLPCTLGLVCCPCTTSQWISPTFCLSLLLPTSWSP